mgnify:CR=1 FL=1
MAIDSIRLKLDQFDRLIDDFMLDSTWMKTDRLDRFDRSITGYTAHADLL